MARASQKSPSQQILRVSRQCYEEAVPVFFKSQIFHVEGHTYPALLSLSMCFGLQTAAWIRHVTFTIGMRPPPEDDRHANATKRGQLFKAEMENMRILICALPRLSVLELSISLATRSSSRARDIPISKARIQDANEAVKKLSAAHPPLRRDFRHWPHANDHTFFLLATHKYKPTKWASQLLF